MSFRLTCITLLEVLVDTSEMLSESGIVVVLDAVIGPKDHSCISY
jgi:hypothetical protein